MASFLDKIFARDLAVRIFGLASVAIGLVGLTWGDFLAVWQPVPKALPGRTALAYAIAAVFLLAGASLQFKRSARAAALTLTLLYSLGVVLLHLPSLIAHPSVFVMWSGTAEQLALVAGGLVAYSFCLSRGSQDSERLARANRLASIARLIFGVCLIAFALAHLFYLKATADFVPAWIPPGQVFWAYATAAGHLAAAIAILSGIAARLGARLLTAMFIVFGVLVHAPLVFADPHTHFNWAANAMNLALIAAAWLVAASIGVGQSTPARP
ncbi:MAG TPA: DoxX family membrane protein [Steroidobacteraceae bacterium]|nr:DoxX family membrane protein [Steroidobacteraceae bacterium]